VIPVRLPAWIASAALALAAWQGCAAHDPAHDARIEGQVKARLAADRNANLTRLGVRSRDGTVRLTGTVQTPDEKAEAARITREVRGVQGVVNDVEVGPAAPR
jgi:hyperosmotically inducible protein